jgi:small acid-soluble spore protein (thioredoxin-like protein)
MKHNPDDRSDNVENIQYNIDRTIENINLTEETISKASGLKMKDELEQKNKRREKALESMRKEIKEEAAYQELKQ